jgi:hypothetical protein
MAVFFAPACAGAASDGRRPLLEEMSGSAAGAMIAGLAGIQPETADTRHARARSAQRRPPRRLAIYPASAGFDLVEELDHLCARTIEPNVFFNPRFLAPAMPRLEDREVGSPSSATARGEGTGCACWCPSRSRSRRCRSASPIMRTWSSPFGPLGTPLIDRDDPVGVIEDFFDDAGGRISSCRRFFVLPDMRLDGPSPRAARRRPRTQPAFR